MGPHWGPGGSMMPWGTTASGGLGFLWSLLWLVLFVGVIALAGYLAYRYLTQQERRSTRDPLEILRMRYAQGEIDEAEFERRRDQLFGDAS